MFTQKLKESIIHGNRGEFVLNVVSGKITTINILNFYNSQQSSYEW